MHRLLLRATCSIGMFAKRAFLVAMEDDDTSGRRRKDRAQKLVDHDVLGMSGNDTRCWMLNEAPL